MVFNHDLGMRNRITPIRYLGAVLKEACLGAVDLAQAIGFVLTILLGWTINLFPKFAALHGVTADLTMLTFAKGLTWLLCSAIFVRVIVATYKLAKVAADREIGLEAELKDSKDQATLKGETIISQTTVFIGNYYAAPPTPSSNVSVGGDEPDQI